MRAALTPCSLPPSANLREPLPEDEQALAELLFAAYRGTIDQEEETVEQALLEVRKTFQGEYGEFMPTCSRVAPTENSLLAATLVTRWQGRPFVAFTVSAPEYKRKGLARACMLQSMEALRLLGESEVRLVVTLANLPALRLYESLGFYVAE
jgi:GNAT superfamily N-acetyltransferase